jgi:hypothetical protein
VIRINFGFFRVDGVTISGASGTYLTNYAEGVDYSNGFDDGANQMTHSFVCSVIPDNIDQDSVTVTVAMTTSGLNLINTLKVSGVGRIV